MCIVGVMYSILHQSPKITICAFFAIFSLKSIYLVHTYFSSRYIYKQRYKCIIHLDPKLYYVRASYCTFNSERQMKEVTIAVGLTQNGVWLHKANKKSVSQ